MRRLLQVTVSMFGAFVALDSAKIVVQAWLLTRIRRAHPEMFDGTIAAEQIRLALLDAPHLEPGSTRPHR